MFHLIFYYSLKDSLKTSKEDPKSISSTTAVVSIAPTDGTTLPTKEPLVHLFSTSTARKRRRSEPLAASSSTDRKSQRLTEGDRGGDTETGWGPRVSTSLMRDYGGTTGDALCMLRERRTLFGKHKGTERGVLVNLASRLSLLGTHRHPQIILHLASLSDEFRQEIEKALYQLLLSPTAASRGVDDTNALSVCSQSHINLQTHTQKHKQTHTRTYTQNRV
eukprot:GHVR01079901.1.p1 GENE.GHVR01079901.1~~GHVR01079901.1.p1  ORF type:complete len:244 (+),score=72.15 GHVR01079901.1:75-734(+)